MQQFWLPQSKEFDGSHDATHPMSTGGLARNARLFRLPALFWRIARLWLSNLPSTYSMDRLMRRGPGLGSEDCKS